MKRDKSEKIAFVTLSLSIILLIFSAAAASALGAKLFCLTKGQTIKFSECNPSIQDKRCTTTSCQICVNEIRSEVYCPLNINKCDNACEGFEESIQTSKEDLPKITLVNPSNNLIVTKASRVDFSFIVTDSFNVNSCSLMLDEELVAASKTRIQSKTNIISYNVQEGQHSWNIECKTRDGKNNIKSATRDLIVGNPEIQPAGSINLIFPEDNSTLSTAQETSFKYNFTNMQIENMAECNLIINNNVTKTTNNLSNENTFLLQSSPGNYNWSISCKNKLNKTLSSDVRALTIQAEQPQNNNQQNSGSSGGTGSTGGAIFEPQNKKKQIQNNTADEQAKFEQLNKETNNSETENIPIEEISEKTSKSTITGAVTGTVNAIKNNKMIAIIFIIIIVVFLIMINAMKKNQEDKNIKHMLKTLVVTP